MTQSINIQNLRRNPTISCESFHKLAAQMMGKKGVTDSVKEALRKAGVYFGKRNLSKREYEGGLEKFSNHLLKEKGKISYLGKKILKSIRSGGNKGLVKGGEAEKIFQKGVKEQLSAKQTTARFLDLDRKTRHDLIHKYMTRGELSKEDRAKLSDEGYKELEAVINRIKSMNVYRGKTEQEKEVSSKAPEKGIPSEKAHTSAASLGKEEKENQTGQKSANSSISRLKSSISFPGGIETGAKIETNKDSKAKIEPSLSADVDKEPSTEKSSETPPVKKGSPPPESEETKLSDMEIG